MKNIQIELLISWLNDTKKKWTYSEDPNIKNFYKLYLPGNLLLNIQFDNSVCNYHLVKIILMNVRQEIIQILYLDNIEKLIKYIKQFY